jgi:hypothetical protein
MLLRVFLRVKTQVFARRIGVFRVVSEVVQFVVAHDAQGCSFLDHRPDDLKHLPDFRASINEVA